MQTLLTGDRPTGALHLGHYVGSLKQRVEMQEVYTTYIMMADMQALTDNYKDPKKVRNSIIQLYKDYYAVGIDFAKANVFIQSLIPEISELAMYFFNLVSHSEVVKNPTVKTEIEQKKFGESVPFGFVSYPVSQAADILCVNADIVPVGADQLPMIEITKTIAKRFNKTYGVELFVQPEARLGKVNRLPGTDGNAKMGKSLNNAINLNISSEDLKEKIMKMYSDPNRVRATDPGTVEGNPVFIYHDSFNPSTAEVDELKDRYRLGKVGDVEVKEKLFLALEKFFVPIRQRYSEVTDKNEADILAELKESSRKVQLKVQTTMAKVKQAMGIDY